MRKPAVILLFLLMLTASLALYSQRNRIVVGPMDGGGFLLNSGWLIRPAGKDIELSTMPMSHAMSPDGRTLAVLNGGYNVPSVSLLDLETSRETGRHDIGDGWRGLAYSAKGDRLYAGNGARASVTEFQVADGKISPLRQINLFEGEPERRAHLIAEIVPLGNDVLVVDSEQYEVVVLDAGTGKINRRFKVARNPYSVLLSRDRQSLFLTSWSTAKVYEYRISDGKQLSEVEIGAHPTEMVWLNSPTARDDQDADDARLAIACANTNFVYILSKTSGGWRVSEKVNLALTPRQPVGMTPSALSLSQDRRRLYVACSDANAVAVVDVSNESSRVLGYIPTGWYPTSVRALADGRVLVLNGKGGGSRPNPDGPNPNRWPTGLRTNMQYVASIQHGSASIISPFTESELAAYTRTVFENSPYRDSLLDDARVMAGGPIPNRPGAPSPIKHVILLMKENRTYDQVLGDMKEGNGDPNMVLFGENITPNHHQLAREFALLDNFYVNADVSEDGYYWTTAAIAPDSTARLWPMGYARRKYVEPPPGPEGLRTAPGGHIWDKAKEANVSFFNYGFAAINLGNPPDTGIQIKDVEDPVLKPYTSYYFRQHDRFFSDVTRIRVFLHDLAEWEKKGDMPSLILMTIGNDHTDGTTPGHRSPISCVADNDQAFGTMVEGITNSKFWSSTAMFVLEDDAQDGADHVDSHRSPAYVISPYTRRGVVDSTLYNTTSVLRTIELILGMKPMTIFDAAARPLDTVFQARPNLKGYRNQSARVPVNVMNPANSATAARSAKLDFSKSDLADDDELNDILWLAIRGTAPPVPVRSRFAK